MPFRRVLIDIKRTALSHKIRQILEPGNRSIFCEILDDTKYIVVATAAKCMTQQNCIGFNSLCYVMPKDCVDRDFANVQQAMKAVVLVDCTCCNPYDLIPLHINDGDKLRAVDDKNYMLNEEHDNLIPFGKVHNNIYFPDYTLLLFRRSCDIEFLQDLATLPKGGALVRHLMECWLAQFTSMASKNGHLVVPWTKQEYDSVAVDV